VTRGHALFLTCALAAVVAGMPGSAAESPATPNASLKTIRSRAHAKGASLVIEATEPVPYLTARPDPLTVLIDFRNVGAEGLANAITASWASPIARVGVEAVADTNARVSRVRISLSQPVAHQVHSDRNTVVVDFEKPSAALTLDVRQPVSQSAPDAMQALAQVRQPAVDPIAALVLSAQGAPPQTAAVALPAPPLPARPLVRLLAASQTQAAPGPLPQALPPRLAQPPLARAQAPAEGGAAPRAPITVQGDVATRGRTYTGTPISLDFQQADLRAVLRLFAEVSGLNIVIDPAVQGSVDVALKDVPWDQALDMILRANKLGYLVDGTIVRIAPLSVLADEEAQRRKLMDEQALAGQLQVLTRTLSYARAEELQTLLTRSALSQRGTVQIDTRTNTLIISDLQERLNTASELIQTLDRPQPQVEIEARIVQTNKNFARELGVQWGFSGRVDPMLGNTTNLAFPNRGSLTGTVGPGGTAVNLPVGAATSGIGLALGSVNGAFNLDVALSALEQSGNGRILSTPRVSTLNNVEAEVTQGVQSPLQTIANNTVTVTFKDAALTLKVTPQITAADTVIMKITLENATPDFSRAAGPAAIPPIDTQRAITTLLVNDGQTTVIGGIYTSNQQSLTNRTPGLGQIPLLNWLFKRDRVSDESRELLIFITPRIIRG
jgi:type IV pilus secretin PilQ/predicted competence protein